MKSLSSLSSPERSPTTVQILIGPKLCPTPSNLWSDYFVQVLRSIRRDCGTDLTIRIPESGGWKIPFKILRYSSGLQFFIWSDVRSHRILKCKTWSLFFYITQKHLTLSGRTFPTISCPRGFWRRPRCCTTATLQILPHGEQLPAYDHEVKLAERSKPHTKIIKCITY